MNLASTDSTRLRAMLIEMAASGHGESGNDQTALRRFLPLPDHARVFEPETFLIIGQRGAGKTELFRAIQSPEGRKAVVSASPRLKTAVLDATRFVVGYQSSGSDFPAEMVFRKFAATKDSISFQQVWLGLLLRSLHRAGELSQDSIPNALRQSVTEPSVNIELLAAAIEADLHAAITLLDTLDSQLGQNDCYVYVAYDELDRVSASDWDALAVILRGLIQFWSSNARRWRRLRPKIFLRHDLYERAALVGPDVSKLSAQRLSLSWQPKDLYALMMKRFVNQDNQLAAAYLGSIMPDGTLEESLGWMPKSTTLEDFRQSVERICGEFMGASANKGRTFSWILTHLQDSHGQVLPRSFVKLFEKAAEIENRGPKAVWPRLIHHSSLRGAIDQVSLDRMEEFKEELPWIDRVRGHLVQANISLPVERRVLTDCLNKIDWSTAAERPPQSSGHDILQFLGELGIFYIRKDERIDARDIYLEGFGFKRKGGVKRPF